jgi:uncharacterized membrane protein
MRPPMEGIAMLSKIRKLDPNTKTLIRTAVTIIAVNAAVVFVVKALENKTNEA